MVVTAGGTLKRAATPWKAVISPLEKTAAGVALWTGEVIVTNCRRLNRRRRRGTRVGRVLAFLDGIRGLHCDSTYASGSAFKITLHPDIAFLTPTGTPWVSHNPVINTIFCAISNRGNAMVQCSPTDSSKYTLKKNKWKRKPLFS